VFWCFSFGCCYGHPINWWFGTQWGLSFQRYFEQFNNLHHEILEFWIPNHQVPCRFSGWFAGGPALVPINADHGNTAVSAGAMSLGGGWEVARCSFDPESFLEGFLVSELVGFSKLDPSAMIYRYNANRKWQSKENALMFTFAQDMILSGEWDFGSPWLLEVCFHS